MKEDLTANKATSGRGFTKAIVSTAGAALMAASLASCTSENSQGNSPKDTGAPLALASPQQPKSATEEIRSSHNTPPDIVVTDGSLIIESDDELEKASNHDYQPKDKPSDNPNITHVRVLVDNGDKVYEDLEAEDSTVTIGWQNNGGAPKKVLDILNQGGKFTIKSDKDLTKKNVANKPRKHKLVYSEGENFRIAFVAVTNRQGLTTTFSAPSTFESVEFRILIWRH